MADRKVRDSCINKTAIKIAQHVAGLKSGRLLNGLKPD